MKVLSNACIDISDDDDLMVTRPKIAQTIYAYHNPTYIASVMNKWEIILCDVSPEHIKRTLAGTTQ